MPEPKAYIADRIFTGEEWLNQHAILVEHGSIQQIVPVSSLPSSMPVQHFDDGILVPSFIDLQIYGAYGKLLAVYPEADSLFKLSDYCRKGGAAFCLPTVATNTKEVFLNSIDAVKEYWKQDGEGVLGLHLEGPWINPVKRGAHIESLIHPPSLDEVKELLDYGKGIIKMITLAPEVCSKDVIELILSYDIIISAGHSNATYSEATESFENGITAVTHLYNAMSPLQHRQPGLAGAAMDHRSVMSSIIPDGHHVDYPAIRIAKNAMQQRLFAITDAVTETAEGHYQHYLAGDKYEAANILSGSALTMDKALKNLVGHCGIDTGEAIRMCSLYPAQVMKLDNELGRIAKGYRATITLLDASLTAKAILF
ncbi:MAG TPA: N-acetylglucosamine-6-phosphate deacetylase [Chitinophagaceae bacterium]